MTQHTRQIFTGSADSWDLAISVRAGLGRWMVTFEFRRNGQVKTRTGAWLNLGRWDSTRYNPEPGSEARAIAEAWLRDHPVPAPGAAGVTP